VATGTTTSAQICFPITARDFASADFRSRVGTVRPGVLQTRPDLLPLLERFQPLASPKNGWLADLATLANRTKHVELDVNSVAAADVKIYPAPDGKKMIQTHKRDGRPLQLQAMGS